MRGNLAAMFLMSWLSFPFGTPSAVAAAPDTTDPELAASAVAVQRVNLSSTGLRDEVGMLLVGSALIGLAAAVRRAA